jgi:hypothetical protein
MSDFTSSAGFAADVEEDTLRSRGELERWLDAETEALGRFVVRHQTKGGVLRLELAPTKADPGEARWTVYLNGSRIGDLINSPLDEFNGTPSHYEWLTWTDLRSPDDCVRMFRSFKAAIGDLVGVAAKEGI